MAVLRLRDLREDRDMTQAEVAAHLQIARESYSRYETGTREMPYDSLLALAELFSVSVDYLLGRYDTDPVVLSDAELAFVRRFRVLDRRGKRTVSVLLEHEYTQIREAAKKKEETRPSP